MLARTIAASQALFISTASTSNSIFDNFIHTTSKFNSRKLPPQIQPLNKYPARSIIIVNDQTLSSIFAMSGQIPSNRSATGGSTTSSLASSGRNSNHTSNNHTSSDIQTSSNSAASPSTPASSTQRSPAVGPGRSFFHATAGLAGRVSCFCLLLLHHPLNVNVDNKAD